jgi:hypothetical protein
MSSNAQHMKLAAASRSRRDPKVVDHLRSVQRSDTGGPGTQQPDRGR